MHKIKSTPKNTMTLKKQYNKFQEANIDLFVIPYTVEPL
jgi:hypothetical protein